MEIFLAKTQGFCAGVASAVEIVEKALEKYGSPLYVYHEIVHNTYIVNDFKERGVVFVESIEDVPAGERIIFSAHGIPPVVIEKSKQRQLKTIDATCPLVTKVHNEAIRFSKGEAQIILIGHKGHQELIGTSGYVQRSLLHIVENEKDIEELKIDKNAKVAYLTQTTLSVDEAQVLINKLKAKFPNLNAPSRADICYATQSRQDSIKELAGLVDVIIVCGSPNSSNSNRLRETGENAGIPSYIIDKAKDLDLSILKGKRRIGITSGASVPRCIVEELITHIKNNFEVSQVHTYENPEKDIVFPIPKI